MVAAAEMIKANVGMKIPRFERSSTTVRHLRDGEAESR